MAALKCVKHIIESTKIKNKNKKGFIEDGIIKMTQEVAVLAPGGTYLCRRDGLLWGPSPAG